MFIEVSIFFVGLILLSWSADRFVHGASALAQNIGLSPMLIGLTIVAMGSSAPEIMVAASASLNGNIDTAVGNAIGSNITNIALVLGVTAVIKPLVVSSTSVKREMPIAIFITALVVYLLHDQILSFPEGILLAILFFTVIGGIAWISFQSDKADPLHAETKEELPKNVKTSSAIFWLLVGMILLPLSAHFMVESAVDIAHRFGISDLVIGLTIIAIGTSLPELAASIAGVIKGEDDLALGNIIGSCIFNALAVLSMPALIAPGVIDALAATRDSYVMLGLTLMLVIFSFNIGIKSKRRINRFEGLLLLTCFVSYQICLFN